MQKISLLKPSIKDLVEFAKDEDLTEFLADFQYELENLYDKNIDDIEKEIKENED